MSGIVSWNLQLSVNEDQLETFRGLMAEMVESTQAEPGALAYDWFLSEDQTQCHIYERYADAEAVMAHLGAFGTKFAERFLACVTPTAFHVYGNPEAEAREVFDGFGAVYFGPFGGFSR